MKTFNAFQRIDTLGFIHFIFCLLLLIPLLLHSDSVKDLLTFSTIGKFFISILGILIIWGGYFLSIVVPLALFLYVTELLYNYLNKKSTKAEPKISLAQNQTLLQVASISTIFIELYLSIVHGKLSLIFCLLVAPWYKHWYNGLQF